MKKGFTLIELLICVVIVGILLAAFVGKKETMSKNQCTYTVEKVGGCDKDGYCGAILTNGAKIRGYYPVEGQEIKKDCDLTQKAF